MKRTTTNKMIEALTRIPVDLDTESLMKRVHVRPRSDDATTFEQLVIRARDVAKPKVLLSESFVEARGKDTVQIGGITFTSLVLRANLKKAERVFPYVATCGHELDEVSLPKDEFLAKFWWDTIKADVLGCAISHLHDHLQRRFLLFRGACEVFYKRRQVLIYLAGK